MRTHRLAALAAAATAAAASVALVMPPPAYANPTTDVTIVRATSVRNSSFAKSVTADCPIGTSVTNVAGDIKGGVLDDRAYVVIDDLFPDEELTSATVTAIENAPSSHFTLSWSVTAIVTCSPTPDQLSWNWEHSDTDSRYDKDLSAYCPAGTVPWGGGATIEGGDGRVFLDMIYPWDGGSVYAQAREAGEMYEDWTLNTFAICAEEPPGYQVVFGQGALYDGEDGKASGASCPTGVAVGGGFEVFSFIGGAVSVDLIDFAASVNPTTLFVEAFEDGHNDFSSDPDWSLNAWIICGDV